MRTSPTEVREVADEMLVYLYTRQITDWPRTYPILLGMRDAGIGEVFLLWKGYELLRKMGRLALNSPSGHKGAHVVNFSPLAVAISVDAKLCCKETCPILKSLSELVPAQQKGER